LQRNSLQTAPISTNDGIDVARHRVGCHGSAAGRRMFDCRGMPRTLLPGVLLRRPAKHEMGSSCHFPARPMATMAFRNTRFSAACGSFAPLAKQDCTRKVVSWQPLPPTIPLLLLPRLHAELACASPFSFNFLNWQHQGVPGGATLQWCGAESWLQKPPVRGSSTHPACRTTYELTRAIPCPADGDRVDWPRSALLRVQPHAAKKSSSPPWRTG
jgi:hypothetical protein